MKSDWTDIKQTDKYSNMFQPGSHFDHVHAVGDAREFIQTYAKALLKRANQYIWGLAVGLGAMLVVTVLAFASGSILEIDELTFEIVSFIFSIILFMMLKKLFTNCNNKKLAKKILDPSLLNELSDEEIIRRANDAIDIYNRQMAVSYQEEEEPQHKSLSDQETGDEDRVQNTEYSDNKQKEKQTVMLNGVPVELNDGNSMNGKRVKRRNSTLSRGQIGLIIGVITAILFVGAVVVEQNPSNQDITEDFYYTEYDTSEDQETEETPVPISDDAEKALETAKTYAQLDMSKDMIYDKLIHGPGSFCTKPLTRQ